MAGVPGFEPGLSVLETDVLTVDTIPLRALPIADFQLPISIMSVSEIGNRQLAIGNGSSLGLFMTCVLAATATKLAEFQPVGCGLLILRRYVVPTLAISALKHDVIAWHNLFPISD